MGPRTDAPADSVRCRGARGESLFKRLLPKGLIAPELCIFAAILAILVVGISLSGQAGSEEDRTLGELGFHASPVEGVAFAPDGKTAASVSRDGAVVIWDLASRRSRRVVSRTVAGFSSVAFSPDGTRLVAGGLAEGVKVINPTTGAIVVTLAPTFGGIRDVTFSPDGTLVAAGGDHGEIRIWNLALTANGQPPLILRGHEGLVSSLAFAPDGQTLASAGIEDGAILWDLPSGRIRQRLQTSSVSTSSVAFTRDGRSLAMGGVGCITLQELATGRSRTWKSAQGRVTAVRFLPDGLGLASSGLEGTITVWSVSPNEILPRLTLPGHKGGVKSLAMSPDGSTLISGGNDDAVKIWDLPRPGRLEVLSRGEHGTVRAG